LLNLLLVTVALANSKKNTYCCKIQMQTSNRLCDGQYIGLVYFTTVAMKLQQKRFRLMMTNPNVAYTAIVKEIYNLYNYNTST